MIRHPCLGVSANRLERRWRSRRRDRRTEDPGGSWRWDPAPSLGTSKMVASASTSFVSGSNRGCNVDDRGVWIVLGSLLCRNWDVSGGTLTGKRGSDARRAGLSGDRLLIRPRGVTHVEFSETAWSLTKRQPRRTRRQNDHVLTPLKIIYLETSTKLLDHVGRSSPGTGFSGGPIA